MNTNPKTDCLDLDGNHATLQYKYQAFGLQLKEDFLGFYMNANWNTSTGLPKADLDALESKGEVEIDQDTQIQV